jgi:hypothetical protein
MPENRVAHIKRFVQDEQMANALHEFFTRIFLKSPRNKDVQSLAAAWMAKNIFEEAWRELQSYKRVEWEEKPTGNIGV